MTKHSTMANVNDDDLETLGLDFDPDRVARPGFKLASFKDAALPVMRLTSRPWVQKENLSNRMKKAAFGAFNRALPKIGKFQPSWGLGRGGPIRFLPSSTLKR